MWVKININFMSATFAAFVELSWTTYICSPFAGEVPGIMKSIVVYTP